MGKSCDVALHTENSLQVQISGVLRHFGGDPEVRIIDIPRRYEVKAPVTNCEIQNPKKKGTPRHQIMALGDVFPMSEWPLFCVKCVIS